MKKWEKLPPRFQNEAVRPYYEALSKKTGSLVLKRISDITAALILTVICIPFMLVIAIWIKCDSRGKVLFCQKRVTKYGREFRILKFRTMVSDAEKIGTQVTVSNDSRVTRAGSFLRKCRLDELPQLFNVLRGDMTFVGTRPEVPKYVEGYTDEMYATLLMPAGITSLASIKFKDEEKLLSGTEDTDDVYLHTVLPQKMKYNLEYINRFNFFYDIKLMFATVFAVAKD